MKRLLHMIAFTGLVLAAQTVGAQPERPEIVARQQLSQCMYKRMSANRALSYNEAMRTCKARLQPPKEVASITPTPEATKAP
jgi:hypothetical protein